jgi:hypothetical protein
MRLNWITHQSCKQVFDSSKVRLILECLVQFLFSCSANAAELFVTEGEFEVGDGNVGNDVTKRGSFKTPTTNQSLWQLQMILIALDG